MITLLRDELQLEEQDIYSFRVPWTAKSSSPFTSASTATVTCASAGDAATRRTAAIDARWSAIAERNDSL